MKKIVWTYGLIGGAIVASLMVLQFILIDDARDVEIGQVWGYATMVLALSTVFMGIKSYRDKHLGGSIKFGKAFMIGLYITLIAATCYTLTWEVYYDPNDPKIVEMMDQFAAQQEADLRAAGETEDVIAEKLEENQEMMELYSSNILFRMAFTFFLEIFPVGLFITLISAAILYYTSTKKETEELHLSS